MLLEKPNKSAIYIIPPEDGRNDSAEDSASEDGGGLVDNLSSKS